MANKKRRRRPQRPSGGGPAPSAGSAPDTGGRKAPAGRPTQQNRPRADRQARKQQARAAREAAMRAQRRRNTIRRFVLSVIVASVVLGVFVFFTRVGGPNPFPAAASEVAVAAGCSGVEEPLATAVGGDHSAGAAYVYAEEPATSGSHDPSGLSGEVAVYTTMPPETQLVHNLEHAFVNIYYRPDGETALPQEAIDALATLAEGDPRQHVILSPHTSLPDGVDFAVTAWNRLLTCPSTVTAAQATTIAQGFMTAFECTSVAPEPKASGGC